MLPTFDNRRKEKGYILQKNEYICTYVYAHTHPLSMREALTQIGKH